MVLDSSVVLGINENTWTHPSTSKFLYRSEELGPVPKWLFPETWLYYRESMGFSNKFIT